MKLKKLEITGFKSFADKTSIDFPIGISAIVGPNGCGKSNVMDALCWVMGEQSVKQLRGKSMEDVIFSGTKGSDPLNMAEVSLILLNDNGSAPEELKDFTEIMVTRRLFRSGESAYLINKQPCRLKDIHNLFMGSGMGARSYSVIQQGNVGAITEANPEERRYFIEEAAGITRYKNRKTEALRKVEATKNNLLRVMDIMSEIERQMSGLKRQAKKAEIYKKFQERICFLDITLGLDKCNDFTEKINKTAETLRNFHDEDMSRSNRLREIDSAIEEIKLKRREKEDEISGQKSKLFETKREIDKVENELAYLRKEIFDISEEIKGFESSAAVLEKKNSDIVADISNVENENSNIASEINRIKQNVEQERTYSQKIREKLDLLNKELESKKSDLMRMVAEEARYKNIFQTASQNKESLKRRLKRIDEEEMTANQNVSRLEKQTIKAEEQLDALKKENEELEKKILIIRKQVEEKNRLFSEKARNIQVLDIQKNQAESKFSALKKMEAGYQWYKDGVKAIFKRKDKGDQKVSEAGGQSFEPGNIIGLMADILEPEHSFETAVEAVLGDSLQYIITKDQKTGKDSIEFLKQNNAGRSGFIPVSAIKATRPNSSGASPSTGRLLNHISIKSGYEDIAEAILGHVVVADDFDRAIELYNKNGICQTIVVKDGTIISQNGIMIGGSKDSSGGILEKKHEIKELEQGISLLEEKILALRHEFNQLESELKLSENNLKKILDQKNKNVREEIDAEKALYKATEDLKHAKRNLAIIHLEQERIMGEESDLDDQITKFNYALANIEREVKEAQEKVSAASADISSVSIELESYNQKILDLKLELTAQTASLENNINTLRRLKEFYEDGKKRLVLLTSDITQKKQRQSISNQKIFQSEPKLLRLYDDIKSIEQNIEDNEKDYHVIDDEIRNHDKKINQIKDEREQILQKIRLLEIEHSQLQTKREHISGILTERYQGDLPELEARIKVVPIRCDSYLSMTIEEVEYELGQCRKKIDQIKDVNLGAIKEYEQLKSRYDFLAEQRDDLQKAIDNLHKVIKKINKITQEKFLETFYKINEKLDIVFPRLFEGGSAKLVMTEAENPLETGVEFMIHPPGKKLTRLSLLSGGEKALSAIAFIFSIFLIKPTSFCLMDEIDAPLDDANVFRFNDLLKIIGENSQIIMITHNKKSMEFADSLFGITMEKKGVSKIVSINFQQP